MKFNATQPARAAVLIFSLLMILLVTAGSAFAAPRDKERWDSKYDNEVYIFGTEPVRFIRENLNILPKGKVLDIAMGEGRNGVYLAANGFEVEGIDISEVGLKKAHKLAEQNGAKITTRVVDLENAQLPESTYDVVLCTYYMQRDLIPQMKKAVKPGGVVVFETYNEDYLKYRKFNPEWVLKTNELLDLFSDFKILRYQAFDDGTEAYSSIIAKRR